MVRSEVGRAYESEDILPHWKQFSTIVLAPISSLSLLFKLGTMLNDVEIAKKYSENRIIFKTFLNIASSFTRSLDSCSVSRFGSLICF